MAKATWLEKLLFFRSCRRRPSGIFNARFARREHRRHGIFCKPDGLPRRCELISKNAFEQDVKVRFNPRYDSLDHWRGVAALWVLMFHGFGSIRIANLSVHPLIEWLKWISDRGSFGVQLFFVISGYCIAANIYRCHQKRIGAWGFFSDRLLRIYPTYWVACLIAILMNAAASPFNHVPLRANLPENWRAALANVFLVEPYVGYNPFLLVSWSLVYELGFYLMVALGFSLWRRGAGFALLLAMGVVCGLAGMLGVPHGLFYVLTYWPEFMCGGLVFIALWTKHSNKSGFWLPLVVMCGLVIPKMFAFPTLVSGKEMAETVAFALILFFLYPFDKKISNWRPLHWLAWVGTLSYSLYLTHIVFMGKVIGVASRWVAADSLLQLPVQLVGWGSAIIGAWLVFKFCEQPLERWRHSLRHRSFAPAKKTESK